MASLLDKFTTLISANLHSLMDQALQNNSPAVIDDYIRQVENNLEDLEDATAAVGGEVKGIQRRLSDQEQKAKEMDKAIDAFLLEGNESAAVATQSRLNSANRLVEAYKEQLERQDGEYQNLLGAKVKLEARLATMKAEREELVALLELAKSKETTVKIVKGLKDIAGTGDSDIRRVAESIYSRLDKANAASEMHTEDLDSEMDRVLDKSKLDSQLADRKAKLGLSQPTEEPATPQGKKVRFDGTMTEVS